MSISKIESWDRMIEDKKYCMSAFLMYRSILDKNKTFKEGITPYLYHIPFKREGIHSSQQLKTALQSQMEEHTKDGKAALALSGGIDSAVLAKFMPKGSVAYTFKCVVPGIEVVDESQAAAKFAKECGLEHRIVEIYWEDIEKFGAKLMLHKGAPMHSIEIQIYKAALEAKKDGFTKLIFGESADVSYGGFSQLLSKDWKVGEFIERYSYVLPWRVLKEPELVLEPIFKYEKNGYIDVHGFTSDIFFHESMGTYTNACNSAGIELVAPYANTYLAEPLDMVRIRNGENKYIIRDIFKSLYKDFLVPEKLPMPRPVNEWFKNWEGPKRPEFWQHCVEGLTGDQKWLIYVLEKFLDLIY